MSKLITTGYSFMAKLLLEITPTILTIIPAIVINIKIILEREVELNSTKRNKNINPMPTAIYLGGKWCKPKYTAKG